jgi:PhzF family phenazine biosynthesis protein
MMPPIYQVDAFTDTPFHGNPAAVCLLDEARESGWMQAVAAEMNLSETAFVRPHAEGFGLRWFTPTTEVNLCGHATLATAHILWETARLAAEAEAHFHTRSGRLTARRRAEGIELDFPADPISPMECNEFLKAIFGAPVVAACRGQEDWLVELASEEAVCTCHPDLTRLAALPARGLIITARGSGNVDFVSRFFAPAAGIDEDPVTGSAHCTLAGYWSERLGKTEMAARQVSARGGSIRVRLNGERVALTGKAVIVLRGELNA